MGLLLHTKFQHNPSSRSREIKSGCARAQVQMQVHTPPLFYAKRLCNESLTEHQTSAQSVQPFARYESGGSSARAHVQMYPTQVPDKISKNKNTESQIIERKISRANYQSLKIWKLQNIKSQRKVLKVHNIEWQNIDHAKYRRTKLSNAKYRVVKYPTQNIEVAKYRTQIFEGSKYQKQNIEETKYRKTEDRNTKYRKTKYRGGIISKDKTSKRQYIECKISKSQNTESKLLK